MWLGENLHVSNLVLSPGWGMPGAAPVIPSWTFPWTQSHWEISPCGNRKMAGRGRWCSWWEMTKDDVLDVKASMISISLVACLLLPHPSLSSIYARSPPSTLSVPMPDLFWNIDHLLPPQVLHDLFVYYLGLLVHRTKINLFNTRPSAAPPREALSSNSTRCRS